MRRLQAKRADRRPGKRSVSEYSFGKSSADN